MEKSKNKKTPTSNTGVIPTKREGLKCRVDWIQGTLPTKYLKSAISLGERLIGKGCFEKQPYGVKYFEDSYRHPSGAVVGRGLKLANGFVDDELSFIQLSGSVVSACPITRIRKYMRVLFKKYEFHPTRIDLAIDDYDKGLKLESVVKAGNQHKYTGFGDTFKVEMEGRNASKGFSVIFGKRGSAGGGKRATFYDKSKESNGLIDAIRIEFSFYDHYCYQSFKQLCYSPIANWGKLIGDWISGAIDFRDRQGENDKNPGRRKRLSWWKRIVDQFDKIKPDVEYEIASLDKIEKWMFSQVAPSLAVLFYAVGGAEDWEKFEILIWQLLFNGESRFKEKHKWLISTA